MVICKKCFVPMVGVMSFSKDKREKYCKCPRCKGETKRQRIQDEELDFKTTLNKAIKEK